MTHADRIRAMTDEELARFMTAVECHELFGADCGWPFCPKIEGKGEDLFCNRGPYPEKLEWLRKEI